MSEIGTQDLITAALWLSKAVHELKDSLGKEGSRGERKTLEDFNSALTELLDRYKTGEWKGSPNGNNSITRGGLNHVAEPSATENGTGEVISPINSV